MQVWGSAQQKGVEAVATLDEKLEKTPLLEELDPNERPDEVTDSNGNITQDCSEVSALAAGDALSFLHPLCTRRIRCGYPRWLFEVLLYLLML